MDEDGDELVGFAMAECGSDGGDTEEELLETGEGSGVRRRM